MRTLGPLTILVALLFSGALSAQLSGVGGGATLERYGFANADATGISSLTLVTVPFGAQYRIGERFDLALTGAVANGSLTPASGESVTLSGLTDTSVRASWALRGDLVRVSVGVLLPTGKSTQSLEQARVSGAIASDLLPFRISNWGAGGGVDASVALAASRGSTSWGARAGFRSQREFEPLDDPGSGRGFAYDPGDQLYARVALDHRLASGSQVSVSLTGQNFGDDRSDGSPILASGPRVQLLGSLAFPWLGRGAGFVYGGVLHRSEGELIGVDQEGPTSQSVMLAGGGARIRKGDLLWSPSVDARLLRTGSGRGQGVILGIGGSVTIPRGALDLIPTARVRLGSLTVADGVTSGITGFEIGMSVRGGGR